MSLLLRQTPRLGCDTDENNTGLYIQLWQHSCFVFYSHVPQVEVNDVRIIPLGLLAQICPNLCVREDLFCCQNNSSTWQLRYIKTLIKTQVCSGPVATEDHWKVQYYHTVRAVCHSRCLSSPPAAHFFQRICQYYLSILLLTPPLYICLIHVLKYVNISVYPCCMCTLFWTLYITVQW